MEVGVVKIIDQLIFRRHFRDSRIAFLYVIEDSTVSSRRDLPFEIKFKILKFFRRINQIATAFVVVILFFHHFSAKGKLSVDNSPSRRQAIAVVGTPSVKARSVKKR